MAAPAVDSRVAVSWSGGKDACLAGDYACAFDAALTSLRSQRFSHMVFGDIDLAALRDWITPRCASAGIEAVFPLWNANREDGEFHTAVTFAPGMAHAVPLLDHGVRIADALPPLAPTRLAHLKLG